MSIEAPAPLANMGQPAPRLDARAKVTGIARYAADLPVQNPAYAFLVMSVAAPATIAAFNLDAARAVPGVLDIMTFENSADAVKKAKLFSDGGEASTSIKPLSSNKVWHEGQIIAVVIADTFEGAREAAHKVGVRYDATQPAATFDARGVTVEEGSHAVSTHKDATAGNFHRAFTDAPVKVEASYSTPTQHHNPIELFSTTCSWDGDKLTVREPSQTMYGLKNGIASQLGIEADNVRTLSPFVGGAFGSKGSLTPRTALIAVAAKRLNRPVRLVATREQGFTVSTYRAETRHRVQLGANKDGKITALGHEGWEVTSRADGYLVGGTDTTARLYDIPNVETKVYVVRADRSTPGFMRSPPEVPYIFALESAMDELAVSLNMNPVELRKINDTQVERIEGRPYSSRSLIPCFEQAAAAFGWKDRKPEPGSMRDGDWLVGWGCATACYPSQFAPAAARVRVTADGRVTVSTATHEIGTGAYTVMAQTAAEKLGVPLESIMMQLGDSDLPPAPVAGGSISTGSVGSAVAMACDAIRKELDAPGGNIVDALNAKGRGAVENLAEWVPNGSSIGAAGKLYKGSAQIVGGTKNKDHIMFAFGAEFVEVRIHARTREIRVPRITGAFAAGHIVNPRTARSQLMGGMIWGISSALHEATEIDPRTAGYVNRDLAEYLVPVNADIGKVDVIFVPETDTTVNPIGVKGLGELGNVGTAAAVANAVYHATGKRIRDLPIRLDALLA